MCRYQPDCQPRLSDAVHDDVSGVDGVAVLHFVVWKRDDFTFGNIPVRIGSSDQNLGTDVVRCQPPQRDMERYPDTFAGAEQGRIGLEGGVHNFGVGPNLVDVIQPRRDIACTLGAVVKKIAVGREPF